MKKIYTRDECKKIISSVKQENKTIGFVPTMGALHKGHLSLIDNSKNQTDVTVSSIFINPTQFNDKSDYEKYPRTLESDLKLLDEISCDYVFIPDYQDIYKNDRNTTYDLGNLDKNMEGAYRPGHFQGVAMVVDRLFDIVRPTKAFFGEKDFQQLQIIRHMVQSLGHQVDIVPCPIIREDDGLAMSSRNQRLSGKERKNAPLIYQTMREAANRIEKYSVQEVKQHVIRTINQNPLLHVEYFEVIDENTLEEVKRWEGGKDLRFCIAVITGNIRLIDNIKISS